MLVGHSVNISFLVSLSKLLGDCSAFLGAGYVLSPFPVLLADPLDSFIVDNNLSLD